MYSPKRMVVVLNRSHSRVGTTGLIVNVLLSLGLVPYLELFPHRSSFLFLNYRSWFFYPECCSDWPEGAGLLSSASRCVQEGRISWRLIVIAGDSGITPISTPDKPIQTLPLCMAALISTKSVSQPPLRKPRKAISTDAFVMEGYYFQRILSACQRNSQLRPQNAMSPSRGNVIWRRQACTVNRIRAMP